MTFLALAHTSCTCATTHIQQPLRRARHAHFRIQDLLCLALRSWRLRSVLGVPHAVDLPQALIIGVRRKELALLLNVRLSHAIDASV